MRSGRSNSLFFELSPFSIYINRSIIFLQFPTSPVKKEAMSFLDEAVQRAALPTIHLVQAPFHFPYQFS